MTDPTPMPLDARLAAYEELRQRYPDALSAGQHVGSSPRVIISPDSFPILSLDIPLGVPGTPSLDEALLVFAPQWIRRDVPAGEEASDGE